MAHSSSSQDSSTDTPATVFVDGEDYYPYIIPVVYRGADRYGDFEHMIHDPEYDDSLFIFNDNVQNHNSALRGRGNAIIRPYNRHGLSDDRPRSAGIPTGFSPTTGGFTALTPRVKRAIDSAFTEIKELIAQHRYRRIYLSANSDAMQSDHPLLGTSIFQVNPAVLQYITDGIYALGVYGVDEQDLP